MCWCDIETQFSGEHGGACLMFGPNHLKGLKKFCESMIPPYFLSWYFTSVGKWERDLLDFLK